MDDFQSLIAGYARNLIQPCRSYQSFAEADLAPLRLSLDCHSIKIFLLQTEFPYTARHTSCRILVVLITVTVHIWLPELMWTSSAMV
jgi:hypothetical protein